MARNSFSFTEESVITIAVYSLCGFERCCIALARHVTSVTPARDRSIARTSEYMSSKQTALPRDIRRIAGLEADAKGVVGSGAAMEGIYSFIKASLIFSL